MEKHNELLHRNWFASGATVFCSCTGNYIVGKSGNSKHISKGFNHGINCGIIPLLGHQK
ncbi:MAG: hypothetical protein GX206_12705 [Clostridiales bacterium]|nr:hypothetical protein [Clostridiales bacterium]